MSAPRPCDLPENIPPCWMAGTMEDPPCAKCGGPTVWSPEPISGIDLWLCADGECGAATNEDGVAVDITPYRAPAGDDAWERQGEAHAEIEARREDRDYARLMNTTDGRVH